MAGVTLLTACDNALNETDYTYSISSETFYNTVEEANAAVLAPLDAMRSAYNSNFFATLEINTEYCYPKGVYQTYKDDRRGKVGLSGRVTLFTRLQLL